MSTDQPPQLQPETIYKKLQKFMDCGLTQFFAKVDGTLTEGQIEDTITKVTSVTSGIEIDKGLNNTTLFRRHTSVTSDYSEAKNPDDLPARISLHQEEHFAIQTGGVDGTDFNRLAKGVTPALQHDDINIMVDGKIVSVSGSLTCGKNAAQLVKTFQIDNPEFAELLKKALVKPLEASGKKGKPNVTDFTDELFSAVYAHEQKGETALTPEEITHFSEELTPPAKHHKAGNKPVLPQR